VVVVGISNLRKYGWAWNLCIVVMFAKFKSQNFSVGTPLKRAHSPSSILSAR
jgi:hypothetical protein